MVENNNLPFNVVQGAEKINLDELEYKEEVGIKPDGTVYGNRSWTYRRKGGEN